MARYVLVEFEENDDAEKFVEAINNGKVFYTTPHRKLEGEFSVVQPNGDTTVRALFAKPTQFCQCSNPGDRSVRGAKFGWYVHAACGKPKQSSWQHPRNLLDPPDLPTRQRSCYLGIVEPAGSPHYAQRER